MKKPAAITAGWRGNEWEGGSALDLILHTKAGALDHDRLGVMEQPVQDGGGDGAVIIEDAGPLFEGLLVVSTMEPRS